MEKNYFSLLMADFFAQAGMEPRDAAPAYALTVDDEALLVVANDPAEWMTLLMDLGPFTPGEGGYARLLEENLTPHEAAPKPVLGVADGRLAMRSQLPLAYLGLDALQRWLRDFLDYSVSVREAVRTLGDGSAVPASGTGDAAPVESGATFIKV